MKWIHNLLRGLSLTAALFVFEACYGTPPVDSGDWPAPDEVASDGQIASPDSQGKEASVNDAPAGGEE